MSGPFSLEFFLSSSPESEQFIRAKSKGIRGGRHYGVRRFVFLPTSRDANDSAAAEAGVVFPTHCRQIIFARTVGTIPLAPVISRVRSGDPEFQSMALFDFCHTTRSSYPTFLACGEGLGSVVSPPLELLSDVPRDPSLKVRFCTLALIPACTKLVNKTGLGVRSPPSQSMVQGAWGVVPEYSISPLEFRASLPVQIRKHHFTPLTRL